MSDAQCYIKESIRIHPTLFSLGGEQKVSVQGSCVCWVCLREIDCRWYIYYLYFWCVDVLLVEALRVRQRWWVRAGAGAFTLGVCHEIR
jgi:hypothetical protein